MISEWRHRRRKRKYCFHHDEGGNPANSRPAVSWIKQRILDYRKLYWCDEEMGGCGKRWVL